MTKYILNVYLNKDRIVGSDDDISSTCIFCGLNLGFNRLVSHSLCLDNQVEALSIHCHSMEHLWWGWIQSRNLVCSLCGCVVCAGSRGLICPAETGLL